MYRKFGFQPRLKRSKAFFFRPAEKWKSPKCRAEKRKSLKMPGGKEEIPKCAGRKRRNPQKCRPPGAYPLHNQKLKCIPTTVLTQHKLLKNSL
ncbi:Uncharacterized protein FWK35_00004526 [Aphis craccivora]|uniref:Uncharacterized protein n=1 Tax=Aphis craccivora TaxID=307492 RepID=A0A6G0ZDC2_APHCR|nr:Uncharacterized protein FWK35_00004526 [Aphis craccivora]